MHSELLRTFDPSHIWMDGWPGIEMDAGRAVMKTPATKAKDLFKVVPHSLFPGLSTITWQQSTRSDLHALDAAYPYCTDIHHLSVPQSL